MLDEEIDARMLIANAICMSTDRRINVFIVPERKTKQCTIINKVKNKTRKNQN